MVEFSNEILIIGYGAVSRCTLPILLRHLKVPLKNITIIDLEDKSAELAPWRKKGVSFFRERIVPGNLSRVLEKYVAPGGLVIDLAWNIDCLEIVNWCYDHNVLYVNTSVEVWDPYKNLDKKSPLEKSLYFRHMNLRKQLSRRRKGSTAVVDHGANPGLISHFTKKGLIDIGAKVLRDAATGKNERRRIERLIADETFPQLAMALGVKVIHVSERDTQIADRPKEVDEFVGTWSIEGLREEGMSPAEMGWGTHEKELPLLAHVPAYGPKNQIFLPQMGMNTWVRSWIPDQEIIGMVIRHGEAFTISERLTVWKDSKPVYRPTVHYAYMPCHETISSLHELRARNYSLQPKLRIMSDEITTGDDILGALLMGHRYNSWWTGSILSIDESRELVPHQNATTMQVAIGIVSAALWMIENPREGFCVPDDLPHEYVLKIAKPYLGKVVSKAYDWTPFKNYQIFFSENPSAHLDRKNPWAFKNFLFRD